MVTRGMNGLSDKGLIDLLGISGAPMVGRFEVLVDPRWFVQCVLTLEADGNLVCRDILQDVSAFNHGGIQDDNICTMSSVIESKCLTGHEIWIGTGHGGKGRFLLLCDSTIAIPDVSEKGPPAKVLASTLITSHLVLYISMDDVDGSIGRLVCDRGTMMGIDVSTKLATCVICRRTVTAIPFVLVRWHRE